MSAYEPPSLAEQLNVDEVFTWDDLAARETVVRVRKGRAIREARICDRDMAALDRDSAWRVLADLALAVQPMDWLLPRNEPWQWTGEP